jgi:hypothetical protein
MNPILWPSIYPLQDVYPSLGRALCMYTITSSSRRLLPGSARGGQAPHQQRGSQHRTRGPLGELTALDSRLPGECLRYALGAYISQITINNKSLGAVICYLK